MRRIVTGHRLAIRVDADTLLAVPPIPPGTPSATRVRILEYVLRRQPGMAEVLCHIAADRDDERAAMLGRATAALIGERPNGVAA